MLADFVQETSSAPGTAATINLAGAVTGRIRFRAVHASGATVFYFLEDGNQAEWGEDVLTHGTPDTLGRTVIGNTAGTTARLNFTGTTRVYNAVPASRACYANAGGQVQNAKGVHHLISSVSPVAAATADFTAGLGSTYDEYLLQLINLQPITDDVQAWLRIGTGGTPTWQSGASAYDTAGRQIVSTGGADFGGVAAQIELTQSGAGNGVGNSTGEVLNMEIRFCNPDATLFYPTFSWTGGFTRSDGRVTRVSGSGHYGSIGAITALRVLFSSGNIGVGTLNLYGVSK